jgi:hypothetical protein
MLRVRLSPEPLNEFYFKEKIYDEIFQLLSVS